MPKPGNIWRAKGGGEAAVLPTENFDAYLGKDGIFQQWGFFCNKTAKKTWKKCPNFCVRAFFQMSLCNKIIIWAFFLRRRGFFFAPKGWQP